LLDVEGNYHHRDRGRIGIRVSARPAHREAAAGNEGETRRRRLAQRRATEQTEGDCSNQGAVKKDRKRRERLVHGGFGGFFEEIPMKKHSGRE
jgi:hypothetical protein